MSHFRPLLQAHGLTEQQWRILRALLDEDALEPRQLCERCLISSPSITGVLQRMEEAGLIMRVRMDHDQRRLSVMLTADAKKLSKRLAQKIEKKYEEIEARVGAQSLSQIYDVLDALMQSL